MSIFNYRNTDFLCLMLKLYPKRAKLKSEMKMFLNECAYPELDWSLIAAFSLNWKEI